MLLLRLPCNTVKTNAATNAWNFGSIIELLLQGAVVEHAGCFAISYEIKGFNKGNFCCSGHEMLQDGCLYPSTRVLVRMMWSGSVLTHSIDF